MHMRPQAIPQVQIRGRRESGRAGRSEHPLSSLCNLDPLLVRKGTEIWSWTNVSLLFPDYFLQLLVNYRNPHYPFLIICSLSKLISRTCWLTLWALHHVWYVVTLGWLNCFYSNYLMENCKGHQILHSRTFALKSLTSLRDVMLSTTSKSAAFTKKNTLTRTQVPGVPVK